MPITARLTQGLKLLKYRANINERPLKAEVINRNVIQGIKCGNQALGVSSPLYILELSRLTHVEKAVKNTTIFVIYKVLVYIQMSQPTTCFGLF